MISWLRKKWKEWVEDWRIAGERSRATVAYADGKISREEFRKRLGLDQ